MNRAQQKIFPGFPKGPTSFGGNLRLGRRKTKRPLCVKRSIHVVMRAEQARGRWSLLQPRNARSLYFQMTKWSRRFHVRVYHFANVGNHTHLIVKAKSYDGLRNFFRVFAGQLAQAVTGARPGKKLARRFWDYIVFTRLIEWGCAYSLAKNYIRRNIQQAAVAQRFSVLRC